MAEIITRRGDRFLVLTTSNSGDPLTVSHADEWMRGSFLEAPMNAGLAVYRVKQELRAALPSWLRRLIPAPRRFWVEASEG